MNQKAVFLFAFAYDPTEALPSVKAELQALQNALSHTEITIIPLWQVTLDQLEIEILKNKENLRVFHFSGHAGANGIDLNIDSKKASRTFIEGLAGYFSMCPNLKLVFLNGCSTAEQVKVFLKYNTPTVIATSMPLIDAYGLHFATQFYKKFAQRNANLSLQDAFKLAKFSLISKFGNLGKQIIQEPSRGNFDDSESDIEENLYRLYPNDFFAPEFDEKLTDWEFIKDTTQETTEVSFYRDSEYEARTDINIPVGISSNKSLIQDLISKGNLPQALAELSKHTDDATLLLSRLNSLKNQQNMGLLSFSDANMEMNRISYAALELSKKLN